MAFSKVPSVLLGASYDADSTTLTLTLDELKGLASGDVDPATGDSRQILLNLLSAVQARYEALAEADRPARFTITQKPISSLVGGDLRIVFTVTFDANNVQVPALMTE